MLLRMFVYNAGNKLMAIEWERINMFNDCFYNSSQSRKIAQFPSMENAQKKTTGSENIHFLFDKSIQKIKPIISAIATKQQIAHFSGCVYKILSLYSLCKCSRKPKKTQSAFYPFLRHSISPHHPPKKWKKNKKRKAENVSPTLRWP